MAVSGRTQIDKAILRCHYLWHHIFQVALMFRWGSGDPEGQGPLCRHKWDQLRRSDEKSRKRDDGGNGVPFDRIAL